MIRAALRATALGFLRDRGALAMAAVVPVAVFLVFAAVFAPSAERLHLTVALADEQATPESARLARAVGEGSGRVSLGLLPCADAPCVREQVRRGAADAGLVIRRDGRPLGSADAGRPAPVLLVRDRSRTAAAEALAGLVERRFVEAMPDVALQGVVELLEDQFVELTDGQRAEIADGLAELRDDPAGAAAPLVATEDVAGGVAGDLVAYYAGAVAVMFALFSAAHAALGTLEDRTSPLLERLASGPARLTPMLQGQFWFIVALGTAQVLLMFTAGWLVHGLELPRLLAPTLAVGTAVAACAAGIALAVTTACRSRRQAEVAGNVTALLVSAVGGSMIPRHLMPATLQAAGWLTPNAWALRAFTDVYWRGLGWEALVVPVAVLWGAGLAGLALARRHARQWELS
ncbi:MAG TPA: ABC transporter permease [Vicinamibacteria bacterium]